MTATRLPLRVRNRTVLQQLRNPGADLLWVLDHRPGNATRHQQAVFVVGTVGQKRGRDSQAARFGGLFDGRAAG
ncbi:hypothetical protein PSYMO_20263, partial [Pseudomonas amygdali pv. mori str. 301020]